MKDLLGLALADKEAREWIQDSKFVKPGEKIPGFADKYLGFCAGYTAALKSTKTKRKSKKETPKAVD